MNSLAQISKARRALAQAQNLEDVLDIRDQAKAIETYLKASKEGLAAQNHAASIKVSAERKAGEMIAKIPRKGGPGRGKKNSHGAKCFVKSKREQLKDFGVEPFEGNRLETIAAVPQQRFDEMTDPVAATALNNEITSKQLQQEGARIKRESKRKLRKMDYSPASGDCGIVRSLGELVGQKFRTVYADPPWQYGNQSTRAATDNHYETMTVDALCKLPVSDFLCDDAHLHLWTTNAFLRESFLVIDAWGFEYRSCYVWVKPQMGIGNYWRVSHEFLMLGIRGDSKRFKSRDQKSWGEFDRTKHSAKPEGIRAIIEQVSVGPFLELFGRKSMPGWTVLGNQIERMLIA